MVSRTNENDDKPSEYCHQLDDIDGGWGCVEVWEALSDRRRDSDGI